VCNGSPASCAVDSWSFEDGSADGFALVPGMVGSSAQGIAVSTVRAVDGTHSLAIPASFSCTQTAFEVLLYPCTSSRMANLQGRTLKFQVYIDGPALPAYGGQEQSVTILAGSTQSVDIPLSVGAWIPVSVPLTDPSDTAVDGFGYTLYMVPNGPPPGNVCLTWSGTIYLDAFSVL
jgi:hypothetical protein